MNTENENAQPVETPVETSTSTPSASGTTETTTTPVGTTAGVYADPDPVVTVRDNATVPATPPVEERLAALEQTVANLITNIKNGVVTDVQKVEEDTQGFFAHIG